ncbi:shikimate dehydrogenase family protein [Paraburkholderia domus]|jgi:Shikimate 5-dehydrogenase|uniref:shikimate dehydrogenase family protein n=1 Tax=Paraburkholderia domus TaxID=2793075 RepID=UPI001912631B|nr:shikimate dehydrogenase [Paraburkholderia domus]MBK5066175.1 shikimate dehydrogenase [Burkholderia sp. R-70199]CAE6968317.1 Shikimate dehydrogenase (NADP(+)) [Paraburkholderia domus]
MPIDGETKIVAIVGDPIAQAKSPELFNALFERHAVNAVLIPLHVPPAKLGAVLDGLRGVVNLAGVVVTVPHKIAAVAYATDLSAAARQTGGANCLRRETDGTWSGAMFDGIGFVKGLDACKHVVRNKSVLLVGTGGAGAGVAHALVDAGVASLDLFDSNTESLQRLEDALRSRGGTTLIRRSTPSAQPMHDLIVNATPCGMHAGDPLPIDLTGAGPDAVVADLIMKPAQTRLLEDAKARGLATHLGRHLLESSVATMAAFLRLVP